ncbi:MAG TPA: hypothetical protein VIQ60_14805 [Gemmatimonadaceae bacterium]
MAIARRLVGSLCPALHRLEQCGWLGIVHRERVERSLGDELHE